MCDIVWHQKTFIHGMHAPNFIVINNCLDISLWATSVNLLEELEEKSVNPSRIDPLGIMNVNKGVHHVPVLSSLPTSYSWNTSILQNNDRWHKKKMFFISVDLAWSYKQIRFKSKLNERH